MRLRRYQHLVTTRVINNSTPLQQKNPSSIYQPIMSQPQEKVSNQTQSNGTTASKQITVSLNSTSNQNTVPNSSNPQTSSSRFESFKQSALEMQPFVLLGICLGVVLVITLIIVFFWRKYNHRRLYEQSPQNFSSKPNLSLPQMLRYQQEIISLTNSGGHSIVRKQTFDGKFLEVTFKTHHNCIYFPNELKNNCYFQIEVVKLSSIVQIGFVHVDDVSQICKQNQKETIMNLDQYGVSVRTDGSTFIYGNNQINFPWRIQFGDTLGIGMTNNQGGRRVWITKNGIVQNPPTQQQRLKYFDISQSKDKETTTVSKKKMRDKQEEGEEDKKQKQETQAEKKKIQLKTERKFKYYAVVISQGATEPRGQTILNWNIGGQNFRLFDAQKFVGLLK